MFREKGSPLLSSTNTTRRRLIARIAIAGAVAVAPVAAVGVPAFADTPSAAPIDRHDHDHDGWRHHHDHDRDNGPWQPGGFPGGFLPAPPPTGSFG
ncbi:hypothetical protein HGA07_07725 [Nocardia veterana]|uniref:Uncharacterized protein n=1 Tax=Nocardia veterana TaxID=132249 RepID=A0A7X6LX27_9NOCA|nr:hypothetical protein [Nocardia veterana]